MCKNGGTPSTVCANSFHRLRLLLPPLRRSPSLEEGGLGGGKIEGRQNVGGRAMRAPTTLRKIATVRCVCNAGLHHCNGWKHLQPSVAPPSSVGARIARPFIPDVITTLREGARRVLGATAKPLYPIDGKAGGLDRRSPRPPSSREGDRPQRWKEFAGGGRRVTPFFKREDCKKTVDLLYCNVRNGQPSAVPAPHPLSERTWQREKAHTPIFGHPRRVRPDFC